MFTIDISEPDKNFKQIQSLTHYGKTIGDFSETAALCKLLDRVVCVDTSIAHLAGAVGCNVDLMLSNSADARWHASGDKSPWYSRMRIHRKNRGEEWSPFFYRVVERIVGQISVLYTSISRTQEVAIALSNHRSKSLKKLAGANLRAFDILTVLLV